MQAIETCLSGEDKAERVAAHKEFKAACVRGDVGADEIEGLIDLITGKEEEGEPIEDESSGAESSQDEDEIADSDLSESETEDSDEPDISTLIPSASSNEENEDIPVDGLQLIDMLLDDGPDDPRKAVKKQMKDQELQAQRERQVVLTRAVGLLDEWLMTKTKTDIKTVASIPFMVLPLLFSPTTPSPVVSKIASLFDGAWREAFVIQKLKEAFAPKAVEKKKQKVATCPVNSESVQELFNTISRSREAESRIMEITGKVFAKLVSALDDSAGSVSTGFLTAWVSEVAFKRLPGPAFFKGFFSCVRPVVDWTRVVAESKKPFFVKEIFEFVDLKNCTVSDILAIGSAAGARNAELGLKFIAKGLQRFSKEDRAAIDVPENVEQMLVGESQLIKNVRALLNRGKEKKRNLKTEDEETMKKKRKN